MRRLILRTTAKVALGYASLWAALSFLFNLAWETAHLRLYTLWDNADGWYVARAVLHCTLGDVVIGTTAFGFAAWRLRCVDWPIDAPRRGTAIVIVVATTFTVWSEWNNVYRLKLWTYLPAMPTIFGIGVTPLLQWILLPPLTVLVFRFLRRHLPSYGDY